MSAPLDFLRIFAGQLRQTGISFAITSGMACVHQMKKTDRDKDWPIVNSLGHRLWRSRLAFSVLHLADLDMLLEVWQALDTETRRELAERRPLLKALSEEPPLTRPRFDLLLMVERLIWERVNRQRYSLYATPWKRFYRDWRREHPVWPTSDPFEVQHAYLLGAACRHHLPADPLAGVEPPQLVKAAINEILAMERFTSGDVASVLPPVSELLP